MGSTIRKRKMYEEFLARVPILGENDISLSFLMFKNDLNISLFVNTYGFNNQKEDYKRGVSSAGPNLG
jgi:hypothetical protein